MKKISWLALCLLITGYVGAVEPIKLHGLVRPAVLYVKNDLIYTLDEATVYIFSLKDGQLIRKFGRAGEGPEEFKYSKNVGLPLSMNFEDQQMVVNSSNRLSYFTMDGQYVQQKNLPLEMLLYKIKGQYVGMGSVSGDEKKSPMIGFRFVSSDYQPGKIIYLSDQEANTPSKLVMPIIRFTYNPVHQDKIYINTSQEDFLIDVFDAEGNPLYAIKKEYPKIKMSDDYIKLTHTFFQTNPRFKEAYGYIKNILSFRPYFPPIRDMQLADDGLHVITHRRQGENQWEMISLDLQGQELGKTFIPLAEQEPLSFYPILYSINQKKAYTLVEDEDNECWSLHVTALNLK